MGLAKIVPAIGLAILAIAASSCSGEDPPSEKRDGGLRDGGADRGISVQITSPADGATVCGDVSIEAQAIADDGIERVSFRVDGTEVQSDVDAPYSALWRAGTTDGTYAIEAVAFDSNGAMAGDEISVDVRGADCESRPTVTITAPIDGATVGTDPLRITADASGPNAIARVRFLIGGIEETSDTEAPYETTWDPGSSGSYEITAVAIDVEGAEDSDVVTIDVDADPPEVRFISPTAGAAINALPLDVTVTAIDPSGVARVELFLDGMLVGMDDTAPYEVSIATLRRGMRSLTAEAIDTFGNRGATTITIDSLVGPAGYQAAIPMADRLDIQTVDDSSAQHDSSIRQRPLDRPTWAPSGGRIAFTYGGNYYTRGRIGLYDVTTGMSVDDFAGLGPDWSPNGNDLTYTNTARDCLIVHPVQGGRIQCIPEQGVVSPIWDPSGASRIAFLASGGYYGSFSSLTLRDTQSLVRQTVATSARAFAWAPSGQQIAYFQETGGGYYTGSCSLYSAHLSNLTVVRRQLLITNVECGSHVDWAPDGSAIAFDQSFGSYRGLYDMPMSSTFPVDISSITPLFVPSRSVGGLDYTPDADYLGFTVAAELHMCSVSTRTCRPVAGNLTGHGNFSFNPYQ